MSQKDMCKAIFIVLGFLFALNLVQNHWIQTTIKPALSARGK